MTSPISSYSQTQGLSESTTPGTAAPRTTPTPPTAVGTAQGEAVTLTPAAQTSEQLLHAARAASGVDNSTVQSLRAAIQADTYNVPPDTLATSIVAALKDL
jgi:flagellar biosynthesis anti-sigma factor FlgM